MKQLRTIIPLSLFKKDTAEYLSKMELMHEPILLTLHGRGAFVIQHLNAYLELAQLADFAVHQKGIESVLQRMEVQDYFPAKSQSE